MNKHNVKKTFLNIETVFPILHFLLTFIWERTLFDFSRNNSLKSLCLTIERNNYMSDFTEILMVYILSKFFAGLMIMLLWKLIFYILKRKICRPKFFLFGIIFLVGVILGFIFFPSTFALEVDNYANYYAAINFLPTYWHSLYTGGIYAGCMMVIPHPFSIFLFQWLFFVIVIAYMYSKIEQRFERKRYKYLALAFFILPETYYIVFNAYRNNFYTILCLFYLTYILFASHDKHYKLREIIAISILSAFIMIYRSEGILIGLGGMLYLFLFVYKVHWKKIILVGTIFIISFVGIRSLHNIGSKKYYGQDYMIINTTNVLYSILNNPQANLSYEGAEEDLANIEAVIPVEVLKEYGMAGYRNYNWTCGRKDFNQTLVDDETASKYMFSYYSIILHNITDYLNVQTNLFFGALGINVQHTTYSYTGNSHVELQQFVYDSWQKGSAKLRETPFTKQWENNEIRIFIYSIISWLLTIWRELWTNTGINTILHSAILMLDILILFYEIIKMFSDKGKYHLRFIILFLIVVAELFAILMFMPEGRPAYLYPMLYTSYLLIFMYFIFSREKQKSFLTGEVSE